MKASLITVLALSTAAAVASAQVPTYTNPGHIAPQSTFTAATSGDLTGTFVLSNAGGQDLVRLFDTTTGYTSPFGLDNFTSHAGDTFNFGHVNAGDNLVFEIENLGPAIPPVAFLGASDAAYSTDATNHVYAQIYNGAALLGFEDLPNLANPDGGNYSDFNYRDVLISVSDVTVTGASTVTPEPGTLALLGTGALGLAGTLRRRLFL